MRLVWFSFALATLVATATPLEYFYDRPTNECDLAPVGSEFADPTGLTGTPYITYVKCPSITLYGYNDASFSAYIFLDDGDIERLWVEAGAFFNITLSEGYVTGGRFAPHLEHSSPYTTSTIRHYTTENAVAGHDEHVNEGASETVDLLWTNIGLYQPPLVMVVSCAQDENDMLWVKDHFHPKGALYVALVGKQCFLVGGVNRCIEAQTRSPAVRWASPLLRYNETFAPSHKESPFVNNVLGRVCNYPIAFAVEKFDYLRNDTLPNFINTPSNTMAITNDVRETHLVSHALPLYDPANEPTMYPSPY